MHRAAVVFALTLAACSDRSLAIGAPDGGDDSRAAIDLASIDLPAVDLASPAIDLTTPPDLTPACARIDACVSNCGNEICIDVCLQNATDEGRTLFLARRDCFAETCPQCPSGDGNACATCKLEASTGTGPDGQSIGECCRIMDSVGVCVVSGEGDPACGRCVDVLLACGEQ